MRNFFSADGRFYAVTGKIVDLVIITFLWLIGCIPVITIFTSTASMYHTVVKCVRYERGKVFEEFKAAYRKNLKQGIALLMIYGAIGAGIASLDYYVAVILTRRSGMVLVLAVGALIFTVLYLMNVLWIIPVFSRFADTLGKILQLNYVISMKYFVRGIVLFLLTAATVIFILASNELIIIFPALVMLLASYLAEPVLHRYMPEQDQDNGDWRYGFS